MSGGLVSAVNKYHSHYVRSCSKRIEKCLRLCSVSFPLFVYDHNKSCKITLLTFSHVSNIPDVHAYHRESNGADWSLLLAK